MAKKQDEQAAEQAVGNAEKMAKAEKKTKATKTTKKPAKKAAKKQIEIPTESVQLMVNETELGKALNDEDNRRWETKLGRPQVFDPEKAVQIMEREIATYLGERNRQGVYWETLPTNDQGGITYRGKPFMTVGVIALMCGVDINTLIEHVNARNEDGSLKNVQLFGSYRRFKELGQIRLLEGGAAGAYSPAYVSFVGNVNYDLIPKQQVEQTVEIKSMDKVYQALDTIHREELSRIEKERAEMAQRKAMLDEMDEDESEHSENEGEA